MESEEDSVLKEEENEWDKYMNLSSEAYLLKTIAPVLYQGLEIVARERPQMPLEFLAIYMLKNQQMVKSPSPPEDLKWF